MKDAVATMGGILPEDAGGRDAVHVAVVSCVSPHRRLKPGDHVTIGEFDGRDYRAVTTGQHIGIVDPFLAKWVEKGERFWLYLYPRTITGLNHHWTHPAFEDAPTSYSPPSAKLTSERWLREYADTLGVDYEGLMEGAKKHLVSGEYYYGPPSGEPGFVYFGTLEGIITSPEFWTHYERVTGELVSDDKRENFFTCSC
jgi:hypothetical protein